MESSAAGRKHEAVSSIRVLLLVLFGAFSTTGVRAQEAPVCVALTARPIQAIGAIHLVVDDDPVWLEELALRAAAMWNDAGCNGDRRFPRIDLERPREAHRKIRVRWEPGFNPAEPRSCGSFVGAEIVLYGRTIDPRTRVLGGCGSPDRIVETLAHELGHAFGLRDRYDAACYGWIMSQLVWLGENAILPRAVQSNECDAADLAFDTPSERRRLSRRPVLLAAELSVDAEEGAAAKSLLTLPESAAPLPPRSARTAPGTRAKGSGGYRP